MYWHVQIIATTISWYSQFIVRLTVFVHIHYIKDYDIYFKTQFYFLFLSTECAIQHELPFQELMQYISAKFCERLE